MHAPNEENRSPSKGLVTPARKAAVPKQSDHKRVKSALGKRLQGIEHTELKNQKTSPVKTKLANDTPAV